MQFPEQDWLEQELKSALERKEPPDGFAAGVAEKLGRPRLRRDNVIPWPSRTTRRLLAAAAAVVLVAGGAVGYRQYQGEMAKREMMRAFAIAGGSLNRVQAHVQGVSQ